MRTLRALVTCLFLVPPGTRSLTLGSPPSAAIRVSKCIHGGKNAPVSLSDVMRNFRGRQCLSWEFEQKPQKTCLCDRGHPELFPSLWTLPKGVGAMAS